MTDKRDVKKVETIDRPAEKDTKLKAEVIADLDVRAADAESLQGGFLSHKPSCMGN